MKLSLFIMSILAFCSSVVYAQDQLMSNDLANERQTFIVSDGDTIPYFQLPQVDVFAQRTFKDEKERQQYSKLVRDVRKAYPYARLIATSIIETYEYMETMPDEKARQKHLEEVQKYLMNRYKPEMKKMTKAQGKILIKLVDRECNVQAYSIVKALLGSLKAGVYNMFAGMFGNSLKTRYDPQGEDAMIEEIVLQIEQGTIDYYYSLNYYGFKGK